MSTDFLLEIFSEEIPARFQESAQKQLAQLAMEKAQDYYIMYNKVLTYVTPKRLVCVLRGATKAPSCAVEKKGPSAKAPEETVVMFCRTWGVSREQCYTKETPKGLFWFVSHTPPETSLKESLAEFSASLLQSFFWPKDMVWGPHREDGTKKRTTWVRPIRKILCLYGKELIPWVWDAEGVKISSGCLTEGHPLAAFWRTGEKTFSTPLSVPSVDEYEDLLRENYVLLCPVARRHSIETQLKDMMDAVGCTHFLGHDAKEKLLSEVVGLAEWPVCLRGDVEKKFLPPFLPEELMITAICHHQRAFPMRCQRTNALAPHFVVVTHMCAPSDAVKSGYERVIHARLEDALFFWTKDRKKPLEFYNTFLEQRLFFDGLGSLLHKVQRLEKLAPLLGSMEEEKKKLAQAARLCKADLATEVVGEFPTLQGVMGKYCAEADGVPHDVAQAIEDHYWPQGESMTSPPPEELGRKIGLMDRLDTLVGFFAIGRAPSGSKDPLALRRAAYGFIRLCLLQTEPFFLDPWIEASHKAYQHQGFLQGDISFDDLRQFLWERLQYVLQKAGIESMYVRAVLEMKSIAGMSMQCMRERAIFLKKVFETPHGRDFLAAYKRVYALVSQEGSVHDTDAACDPSQFQHEVEHKIWELLQEKANFFEGIEKREDVCMEKIRALTEHMNIFMDTVRIMEAPHQKQRLQLLASVIAFLQPMGVLHIL